MTVFLTGGLYRYTIVSEMCPEDLHYKGGTTGDVLGSWEYCRRDSYRDNKFWGLCGIAGGSTGLVHISEVADAYVHDVKDYLKENDKIKVKIISIKEGKIGLSIRQVNRPESRPRPMSRPPRRGQNLSFEDKLARFLKESDERQMDLRRSTGRQAWG